MGEYGWVIPIVIGLLCLLMNKVFKKLDSEHEEGCTNVFLKVVGILLILSGFFDVIR